LPAHCCRHQGSSWPTSIVGGDEPVITPIG
jgi:hypothetical protein